MNVIVKKKLNKLNQYRRRRSDKLKWNTELRDQIQFINIDYKRCKLGIKP